MTFISCCCAAPVKGTIVPVTLILHLSDTASREEVRHRYPDPPTDVKGLDIQQQALLREQQRKMRLVKRAQEDGGWAHAQLAQTCYGPELTGLCFTTGFLDQQLNHHHFVSHNHVFSICFYCVLIVKCFIRRYLFCQGSKSRHYARESLLPSETTFIGDYWVCLTSSFLFLMRCGSSALCQNSCVWWYDSVCHSNEEHRRRYLKVFGCLQLLRFTWMGWFWFFLNSIGLNWVKF